MAKVLLRQPDRLGALTSPTFGILHLSLDADLEASVVARSVAMRDVGW